MGPWLGNSPIPWGQPEKVIHISEHAASYSAITFSGVCFSSEAKGIWRKIYKRLLYWVSFWQSQLLKKTRVRLLWHLEKEEKIFFHHLWGPQNKKKRYYMWLPVFSLWFHSFLLQTTMSSPSSAVTWPQSIGLYAMRHNPSSLCEWSCCTYTNSGKELCKIQHGGNNIRFRAYATCSFLLIVSHFHLFLI